MLGLIDGDVLLHSSLWQTTTLKGAIDNVNRNISEWIDGAFCEEGIIALGPWDGKCYRDDLFPLYKQSPSRVKGRRRRLDHATDTKSYISELPFAVMADNIEADDMLGHWASEDPEGRVIISVDKDLKQVGGNFYNPHRVVDGVYDGYFFTVDLETANLFLLEQLLSGDSMDHIPGLPGIGPKKAQKILDEAEDPAAAVVEKYKEKFSEDWYNHFLINGKLLFIQRKPDQHFTAELYEEMFDVSVA